MWIRKKYMHQSKSWPTCCVEKSNPSSVFPSLFIVVLASSDIIQINHTNESLNSMSCWCLSRPISYMRLLFYRNRFTIELWRNNRSCMVTTGESSLKEEKLFSCIIFVVAAVVSSYSYLFAWSATHTHIAAKRSTATYQSCQTFSFFPLRAKEPFLISFMNEMKNLQCNCYIMLEAAGNSHEA